MFTLDTFSGEIILFAIQKDENKYIKIVPISTNAVNINFFCFLSLYTYHISPFNKITYHTNFRFTIFV